ncbi:hypothetical protein N7462_006243 [Penicillium macrosclerotiorum]|uniref:uncharacterized protein n=1 Tax=Penicillium macrosclerotiorum TaxID=303699 RepID=UPI002549752E|nr:uncharacterized protein N7462_006243 [Penicillium macrosclerotiorum]KAJ5683078.1 hypothetical protein N7462_006243 [Penicillium macrosclerotiorum]
MSTIKVARIRPTFRMPYTHYAMIYLDNEGNLKAFIKFIEPRKQARYPYNGGKPPPGSAPGTTGRMELLLHMIRKLGSHNITTDKLMEAAGDTRSSLEYSSHIKIIYEILRVRRMEERFEREKVVSVLPCGGVNLPSTSPQSDVATEEIASIGHAHVRRP